MLAALRALFEALIHPTAGLSTVARDRRYMAPLLCSIAIGLLSSVALQSRLDIAREVQERAATNPMMSQMSPHEREVAIETARRIAAVTSHASAVLSPGIAAAAVALILLVTLRILGIEASFVKVFSISAHALFPSALAMLLRMPAILSRPSIRAAELPSLLPSNLAAWIHADGRLAGLLGACDLFTFWTVVLLVLGVAAIGEMRVCRAASAVGTLFVSYVAVFQIAAPSLMGLR
jgi:hypothetical protein